MTTQIRSIGALIAAMNAAGPTALTAGGTGDNSAVTGIIIDRADLGWPQSITAVLPFVTSLAAAATLSVSAVLQHGDADDLGDAETFAELVTGVQATGGAGGSTEQGQVEIDLNISGTKRYLRLNFTPDLSAADTDTAVVGAVLVFGGSNRVPV